MEKKGQLQGEFFRFFLIIFIGVVIVIGGFKIISKIRGTSCMTSTELFKDELRGYVKEMHGDVGSMSEKDLNAPCDVDKIYFVDLDKDMSSLSKSLREYPLLMDAIESNVDKNVFLVKNERVVDSFYVGDIELQKPYFVCSDTGRGNIGLYLGGRAYSTEVVNKECVFDCTFETVEVDYDTAKEIMKNASGKCEGCPKGDLDYDMKLYNETKNFLKIARRCNCGRKPGEAVVEILLKPEGAIKQFMLIERIPKDYVDDLYKYEPFISGGDNVKVVYDPLVMWHFDVLAEDTIVSYTLNTDVFEYCADVLETIGYGFPTLSDLEVSDDELKTIEEEVETKDPFKFELPDEYIEINHGGENNSIFNKGVWEFVYEISVSPDSVASTAIKLTKEKFKDYAYNISSDEEAGYSDTSAIYRPTTSSSDYINCSIIDDKRVSCEVGDNFSEGSHQFFIQVTDPNNPAELVVDSFTIRVAGIALVDCSSKSDSVECNETQCCEWCPECDGMRYSGGSNRCVNVGECPYTCNITYCNAQCDDLTKCWDGCYDGRHYYECGLQGCGNDCKCSAYPSDPLAQGCNLIQDRDGDGYHGGGSSDYGYCDCNDNPDDPISRYVYFGNNNTYCDCNSSDGYVAGTEEKGQLLCFDGYDNNCNGDIDGCIKLKCTRITENGCVWNFDDECDEWDRGLITGSCMWGFGDIYVCYDDWETECMENPVCAGGTQLGFPLSCITTCTDIDGDGYSIEGGTCGEIDCNDNNININPGATEVCDDDVDNDCDEDIDCDDEDCSDDPDCVCELTAAYWVGKFSVPKYEWGYSSYQMASLINGSEVDLVVEGTNGCNGQNVNFKVWEYDLYLQEGSGLFYPGESIYISPDPESSNSWSCDNFGCIAKTKWKPPWIEDNGLDYGDTHNNPEYFFEANVNGQDSIKSDMLYTEEVEYIRVVRGANLSATYVITNNYVNNNPHPNTRHIHYEVTFKEHAGIGAVIYSAKRCLDSIGCNFDGDLSSFSIVPAGGQAVRNGYVFSHVPYDRAVITYRARDDNNNRLEGNIIINFP